MDRNNAIGFTLIAAMLVGYFFFFSPTPEPPNPKKDVPQPTGNLASDSVKSTAADPVDSLLATTYGDLASAMKGTESSHVIENEDMKITFSSRGAQIREVELKKYQTYDKKPLRVIRSNDNEFQLRGRYNNQDLDLYQLYYQFSQTKKGDTTVVTFASNNGQGIAHTYYIPAKGYEVRYGISTAGLKSTLGESLTLNWNHSIRLTEKDVAEMRKNSTINYYLTNEGFDNLTESGTEAATLGSPVKWVAIKSQFFVASLIASKSFSNGEVETTMNESDPTLVKRARIKLSVPREALNGNAPAFKFYFGPNDYQTIGDVAEDFSRNVFLGWKPLYWINKYVIFPVFHFLTQTFSNYGVIILILVLLLKLVLLPLSYKSYLSMAKMRVLKPELDEIKERVGDDMAKAQQEQMKLYSQVGVNPISGCVPVLLQMPIILAMFYLFPASIELRQQPFLWAEDLSTYDSIVTFPFVVPFLGSHLSLFTVLMTLTTLISIWQNNQLSSVQGPMKSFSYIMPLIFFFMLNSFSAGLTYYYLISNLVTFGQQAMIKRFVDENKIRHIMEENKKKNAAGGGGKKSKFMTRLEEAMKASEEARRKAEEERKNRKGKK